MLQRERDGYANEASRLAGRLESERAMAEDRFKSLSADALKQNNEQFLTLAKQALGTYQSEAKGELEKREKAVAAAGGADRGAARAGGHAGWSGSTATASRAPACCSSSCARWSSRRIVCAARRERWWRLCASPRRVAAGGRCSCETWSRWPAWSATATSPNR